MAYRHTSISSFLRAVLVTSIIGLTPLPRGSDLMVITLKLLLLLPPLRPLVLSNSLIRCEPVQAYHHEPPYSVPLDPVYHVIFLGYYLISALP
jgi:hypothetical protein